MGRIALIVGLLFVALLTSCSAKKISEEKIISEEKNIDVKMLISDVCYFKTKIGELNKCYPIPRNPDGTCPAGCIYPCP